MKEFPEDAQSSDRPIFNQVDEKAYATLAEAIKLFSARLPSANEIQIIGNVNLNSLNFRWGANYFKLAEHTSIKEKIFSTFPAINERLKQAAVPAVDFLPSLRGKAIETLSFSGKKYLTYRQTYQDSDFFSGSRTELQEMMAIIRRLLDCSADLADLMMQKFDYPSDYSQLLAKLKKKAEAAETPSSFDQLFLDNLPQIQNAAEDYVKAQASLRNLGAFHCDLHPHNLLAKAGKITAVVDLESFRLIPKAAFMGFSAYKLFRKGIATQRISLEEARKMMADELGTAENYYLGALTEILRRIFSVLELHYEKKDFRYDADLKKQLNGLRESKLILA